MARLKVHHVHRHPARQIPTITPFNLSSPTFRYGGRSTVIVSHSYYEKLLSILLTHSFLQYVLLYHHSCPRVKVKFHLVAVLLSCLLLLLLVVVVVVVVDADVMFVSLLISGNNQEFTLKYDLTREIVLNRCE